MSETSSDSRHTPLPPVRTRWDAPVSERGGSAPAPAPPFVAGGRAHGFDAAIAADDLPMPVVPTFHSTPAEYEDAAIDAPATSAQPVIAQHGRTADEPLMPWEEPPSARAAEEPAPLSGPHVTAEAADTARRDLDDWESAIDPDGGQAVPAWGDQAQLDDDAFSPAPRLDEEGAVMAQPERADQAFPLDAFIIPPDAKRLPKGLEHAEELHLEIAEALARRLEAVAQRLRREGFTGLLQHAPGDEPIDTLIAGLLAGYLSNRTDA